MGPARGLCPENGAAACGLAVCACDEAAPSSGLTISSDWLPFAPDHHYAEKTMAQDAQSVHADTVVDRPGPILQAIGLSRRRPEGAGWLLEDVSLELMPAARLALGGPSGAGKTLLLRALALLDPVDAGEVLFRGRPVRRDQVPQFRSQVIYLHQGPAMLGPTVESSLRVPLSLAIHRGRAFDRARVLGWLAQLGRTEAFLQQAASELSGGERQLVALLRALQLEPDVFLLDEPTAALDSRAAAGVEALLDEWIAARPQRRALIWVGHDPAQTQRVAQTALWMDRGRLVGRPSGGA